MLDAKQQKAVNKALNIIRDTMGKYDVVFNTPSLVKDYLVCKLAKSEREQFLVLFLDSRHRLITDEVLFEGTIDCASVYPREIVKAALKHNAGAVILAHNHPSGVPDPSEADKRITTIICKALDLVDIRTLDHIVVGGMETISFAERGLL